MSFKNLHWDIPECALMQIDDGILSVKCISARKEYMDLYYQLIGEICDGEEIAVVLYIDPSVKVHPNSYIRMYADTDPIVNYSAYGDGFMLYSFNCYQNLIQDLQRGCIVTYQSGIALSFDYQNSYVYVVSSECRNLSAKLDITKYIISTTSTDVLDHKISEFLGKNDYIINYKWYKNDHRTYHYFYCSIHSIIEYTNMTKSFIDLILSRKFESHLEKINAQQNRW